VYDKTWVVTYRRGEGRREGRKGGKSLHLLCRSHQQQRVKLYYLACFFKTYNQPRIDAMEGGRDRGREGPREGGTEGGTEGGDAGATSAHKKQPLK
jgi:hypothetical protein